MVLRFNVLSIYRDEQEVKLRQQINLLDLTAVAYLKHPKRENVFGVFTPSKNYYLEASSEQDALEWVALIRRQARIEEFEAELSLSSPGGRTNATYRGFHRPYPIRGGGGAGYVSSSPELSTMVDMASYSHHALTTMTTTTEDGIRIPPPIEPMFAGTSNVGVDDQRDRASYSDATYSDAVGSVGFRDSSLSLSLSDQRDMTDVNKSSTESARSPGGVSNHRHLTNEPQVRGQRQLHHDNERVIWHGYLYHLKSKHGGVRQWKKVWTVLRPTKLAFYKNDEVIISLLPFSFLKNHARI